MLKKLHSNRVTIWLREKGRRRSGVRRRMKRRCNKVTRRFLRRSCYEACTS